MTQRQWRNRAARCALFLVLAALVARGDDAVAQDTDDFPARHGSLVITGFSGTTAPDEGTSGPEGRAALDETLIDLDGGSLKIFDVSEGDVSQDAPLIGGEPVLSVPAGEIGQVFGLALDDAAVPNIYAAATSAFGLQIVAPGEDGGPVRIKTGREEARFMEGQFGPGGGPGSIWRIDGRTGAASLFATIRGPDGPNSGPGLGNLAYDADHQQLYVSDFDTGLIHRVDLSGMDLGTFDHGLDGRPADDLEPVADDPDRRADIISAEFDAENPDTWGFTAPERRVWGLAYHGGRLYYAVWGGPEIWSVAITAGGRFADDARLEVAVPADPIAHPVSDIAFDGDGAMILAQRGEIRARYDYTVFALPRRSRVLRYIPADGGGWGEQPAVYPIGFPGTHQNAAGGVTLGYGYDEEGGIDTDECFATVWATGDALRESAAERDRLAEAGATIVHGAQGTPASLLEPQNVPPWTSFFLDYDGRFRNPNAAGLVGDIEAITRCPTAPATVVAEPSRADEAQDAPEDAPEEPETPPAPLPQPPPEREQRPPEPPARRGDASLPVYDLSVTLQAEARECPPGRTCAYQVIIANEGDAAFRGPLAVLGEPQPPDARLTGWSGPWSCADMREASVCVHPETTLSPGGSTVLDVELTPRSRPVRHCARFLWNGATLRARTALVQSALNEEGFDAGPVDGAMGPQTRSAIAEFRDAARLAGGNDIDDALMVALFDDWGQGDGFADNDGDCAGGGPPPQRPRREQREPQQLAPAPAERDAPEPAEEAPEAAEEAPEPAQEAPEPADDGAAVDSVPDRETEPPAPGDPDMTAPAENGDADAPAADESEAGDSAADRDADAPAPAARDAPSPAACVGGEVWSEPRQSCVCPPAKPVWNEEQSACVRE